MPPFDQHAGQYDGRVGDAGGQPFSRRIAHGRPRSVADGRPRSVANATSQRRTSTITHSLDDDEPDPEPQAVAEPDSSVRHSQPKHWNRAGRDICDRGRIALHT